MDKFMEMDRGFSRPVFRVDLVDEFKDALYALGLVDWVIVREKLHTPFAEEVVRALKDYKNAVLVRIESTESTEYSNRLAEEAQAYHTLCWWSMWKVSMDQEEYERREEDWVRANTE